MVNITDVKQILQFAIDAEIKVFLDGGWGVDALLGYQSRADVYKRQVGKLSPLLSRRIWIAFIKLS